VKLKNFEIKNERENQLNRFSLQSSFSYGMAERLTLTVFSEVFSRLFVSFLSNICLLPHDCIV
jgi:hypothetical protein